MFATTLSLIFMGRLRPKARKLARLSPIAARFSRSILLAINRISLGFQWEGGSDPITALVEDSGGNLRRVTERGGGGGCDLGS